MSLESLEQPIGIEGIPSDPNPNQAFAHQRRHESISMGDASSQRRADHAELLAKYAVAHRSGMIDNLPAIPARWHPSGFMVFEVEDCEDVGLARLHVWPEGLRQRKDRGLGLTEDGIWDGDIHNHAWDINSFNFGGYRDYRYGRLTSIYVPGEMVHSDAEVVQHGLYRRYEAKYGSDRRVRIEHKNYYVGMHEVITKRRYNRVLDGDLHSIETGEHHAPCIPDDCLAATLAVTSRRTMKDGPYILMQGGEGKPIDTTRREVTTEEKLLARKQLLSLPVVKEFFRQTTYIA